MNMAEEEDSDLDSLSQREKEIVGCVVRGMTNKEIAENCISLCIRLLRTGEISRGSCKSIRRLD